MCDIGKHISLRTLHHLIRDHQGSILLITVRGGAVQAEYRYDPWGGRLDPETRTYYAPGEEPELMFGRGYTGHEHLPEYGLIHMNARPVRPADRPLPLARPLRARPGEHAELQPLCVCVE